MDNKLTVEIPEYFLLTIAVHGNMGDGELPDLMRIWAQNECRRLGLDGKLKELQDERMRDLEKRIRNVMGDDAIDDLADKIGKVAKAIKGQI